MIFDWIVKKLVYLYFKVIYRIKVEGLENIPKGTRAILCPNHISQCDGPVIVSMNKRKVWTMSKKEAFKWYDGWIMRRLGCFPVDRSIKDVASLKKSLQLLKDEQLLCIFPEGTRNGLAKGEKLHKGVAYLAITAKAPVVPIGFNGTFKPFTKTIVRVGKPVYFDEYYEDKDFKDKFDEINEKILVNMQMQLTNNK